MNDLDKIKYTVYVDESGEAGLSTIRTASKGGASPYMTLGAAIIKNADEADIQSTIAKLLDDFGKSQLHCADLSHYQIIHFAKKIAENNLYLLGVISRKSTLGSYKNDISFDSKKYYNKCAQYLLERIGYFMESFEIKPNELEIIFEETNANYAKLKNLIRLCQNRPMHKNTRFLRNVDVNCISTAKKKEKNLLQIADLVAHALFKCVDKHPQLYNITEPRYIRELAPRFYGHPKSNKIVGNGIYCVHSTAQLKLDNDVKKTLDNLVTIPTSQ